MHRSTQLQLESVRLAQKKGRNCKEIVCWNGMKIYMQIFVNERKDVRGEDYYKFSDMIPFV